ncbi:hypothetical protein ASG40_10435 [Methylobacterium sp. Leaf399]|uniref:hypothetical protein n=1 Tax=unclassified Methylobacterium TaxID=2615210 RepID=UPI0006F36120|nr:MULTISPECIES: hypothetical protein [unclassified Methylobacterium]KQP55034.1 hypothetical protein ASF39_04685 [Methylobacterium sp. Leaf108]KQT09071.1 hypothetical protein ASG40_10435 [Methylobacterium sp. Leaf399]KQT79007.1 hypothetical protein ASG59_07595 [Methylobacterium sp. Leaf466]
MAFFLGIGGPWIVLMILDLLSTKRDLDTLPAEQRRPWNERLEYLLQHRDPVPSPIRRRG